MHRRGRSLLLLLLLPPPLLLLSSKSQFLLPQTWKLTSREKVTCPTGQNQDSRQTPPIPRLANALSSPPGCSMKLKASPPHRPQALGVTDLFTMEEGPASAASAPGPLPGATEMPLWGSQGKAKASMKRLEEPVSLTHLPSQPAAPCSDHHLSRVIGNWERGYVIHSPVPVRLPGSPAASPSISPNYGTLQGGEAD